MNNEHLEAYRLVFDGKFTIEKMKELKNRLLVAFAKYNMVNLDMGNITDIDVAGIQLICSAKRYFESSNKKIIKIDKNNQLIHDLLNELGYNPEGVCHESSCKKCMWEGDK